MSKSFPGYQVENWINHISFKFNKTPSELSHVLFGISMVIILGALIPHICYISLHHPEEFSWIAYRLFSPLLFILGFQGNWAVVSKYYPRPFIRPVIKIVWFTFGVIIFPNEFNSLVYLYIDPAYSFVSSTVSNICVLFLYLSFHLRALAELSKKEDTNMIQNGSLPTERFFLVLPIFIYVLISAIAYWLLLIYNYHTHGTHLSSMNMLINASLALSQTTIAFAVLCLGCVPRPPTRKTKTVNEWFSLFKFQGG